jgi:hypothetical protein
MTSGSATWHRNSQRAREQRPAHPSFSHQGTNRITIGDTVIFRLALPTTEREENLMAVKLFCLFAAILAGLIAAGVV